VATKREKKEKAKSLIPTIPVPIRRLTPAGRLYQAATLVAQGLIDADPLGIITNDPIPRSLEFIGPRENPLKEIINDPNIKMTTELMEVINDDSIVMVDDQLVRAEDLPTGREVIRGSGQFDRQNLLPRFSDSPKRTRKKTKTDKNMSKALRQANERFRTKSGKLRKGASQAQIMKYAHKLLKKM